MRKLKITAMGIMVLGYLLIATLLFYLFPVFGVLSIEYSVPFFFLGLFSPYMNRDEFRVSVLFLASYKVVRELVYFTSIVSGFTTVPNSLNNLYSTSYSNLTAGQISVMQPLVDTINVLCSPYSLLVIGFFMAFLTSYLGYRVGKKATKKLGRII